MLIPFPLLNDVGCADVLELPCCTTVVVTERVVELELAMTSAITPPATAPPTIGSTRFMVSVSLSWKAFALWSYGSSYP
jgi:hypothetical protein